MHGATVKFMQVQYLMIENIRSDFPVNYSERFSTILMLSFTATFESWDNVYVSLAESFHITEDCRSVIAEVLIRTRLINQEFESVKNVAVELIN